MERLERLIFKKLSNILIKNKPIINVLIYRQENGEMISLFFDMEGAVMANMDMDYTKYIISLFKNYYPYFLNYIIIFEMAWVLNGQ